MFNRQSFIGLTGGFGTVKFGRQKNPLYANVETFDPFGDSLAGDSANLFAFSGKRTDNLISYGYGTNGFRGELQYGLGEVPGDASASRTVAGYIGYRKGPVDVVLTHQNIKNAAGTDSTKVTLLGGNYNFGVVKAFATYSWEKGVVFGSAATTQRDQRDALIGLTAPVGAAGTFLISYIRKTDRAITNDNSSQAAIGYIHNLSKRTALYTSYGELRNDGAAKIKVAAAGNTDKLFNIGIRHFF
ncbi:porin [Undibacterium arcticum]|uniref:porin n=1 Tax=Undibacterium arcticum TaxID=1762892 RepID=UPI00360F537B